MYSFTKERLKGQFDKKIDPLLRAIFLEIVHYLQIEYGKDSEKAKLFITSVLRNKGIHKDGRALDFDWWKGVVTLALVEEIEGHINKHFPYGKSRFKTFVAHSKGGYLDKDSSVINDPDFHIHLQVRAR